ncbi:MAG TPA: hypothetical protein VK806_07240 [Bacteroidia bacterium]|jgi:hypothetical protein|nr:hypothetical protein [Bacteroidia bacterium]
MESFITLLEILMPMVFVGLIAYFIIKQYLEYEGSKQRIEIELSRQEIVYPARMQAYERVILFLERSTPESLIRRVLKGGMSARLFQSDLITSVRNEFDHNLSQQVYMSPEAWSMVKTATEETLRLISVAASSLPETAESTDLAQNILKISVQVKKLPGQVAIDYVKKEFSNYFLHYTVSKK